MVRKARTFFLITALALIAALLPIAALAQDSNANDEDLLLRVNGPVTVAEGETIDNVVVISDNARIDGTITNTLIIIDGDAVVTGSVEQDIVLLGGTLTLEPTAMVQDISMARGEVVRAEGATIAGDITEGDFQVSLWDWGIFSIFVWLGITFVVLVSGLIFAAIGGRQLSRAGDITVHGLGPSLLGALAVWILLPIIMVLLLFTVIGIPFSIGYFLLVLPILWFLGYLVAGTEIGSLILRRPATEDHPYLSALLGLTILQVISAIPFLGGFVGFLAGVLGSGALLVVAWRAWRRRGTAEVAPGGPATEPHPAT